MNPKKSASSIGISVLLLFVIAGATGCKTTSGKPKAWDIKITKKTVGSVEVDLIGISKIEDTDWRRGIKPADYWNPAKPFRKQTAARRKPVSFDDNGVFILKKDDPIWKEWRNPDELVIMANLTGKDYSNDEFDLRRKILPLGKNEWASNPIEIEILDNQIHVVTPPRQ
jgi:hypothetical protein